MKYFSFIVLFFFVFSCTSQEKEKIDLLNLQEQNLLKKFQSISDNSTLKLVDNNEEGKPLLVCLTFLNKKNNKPLINKEVLFYQTSNDGEYHPKIKGDETSAKISGKAITNSEGKIFIQTILPGSYANKGDNRHIHTKVIDAKPAMYEFRFKQYTNDKLKEFIKNNDQFFLTELKKNKIGNLICFLTILVQNP